MFLRKCLIILPQKISSKWDNILHKSFLLGVCDIGNDQIWLRIDARFTPMLTAFRNTFGVAASSAGMPTDSSRCICILGSKLPADREGMGAGEPIKHKGTLTSDDFQDLIDEVYNTDEGFSG